MHATDCVMNNDYNLLTKTHTWISVYKKLCLELGEVAFKVVLCNFYQCNLENAM